MSESPAARAHVAVESHAVALQLVVDSWSHPVGDLVPRPDGYRQFVNTSYTKGLKATATPS